MLRAMHANDVVSCGHKWKNPESDAFRIFWRVLTEKMPFRYDEEIFVFHFTSWWQNKKTRIYTQAFTETPISERHSFAKKMDAPCRYVSTSLLTQISFEDRRATSYVYSEELIWHLIHLFDFETHIFVRGFILTQDFSFVNSFLNNFFAFWK